MLRYHLVRIFSDLWEDAIAAVEDIIRLDAPLNVLWRVDVGRLLLNLRRHELGRGRPVVLLGRATKTHGHSLHHGLAATTVHLGHRIVVIALRFAMWLFQVFVLVVFHAIQLLHLHRVHDRAARCDGADLPLRRLVHLLGCRVHWVNFLGRHPLEGPERHGLVGRGRQRRIIMITFAQLCKFHMVHDVGFASHVEEVDGD